MKNKQLTYFLYILMSRHLAVGVVEALVRANEGYKNSDLTDHSFTNTYLASYTAQATRKLCGEHQTAVQCFLYDLIRDTLIVNTFYDILTTSTLVELMKHTPKDWLYDYAESLSQRLTAE
jgi:hypothetical protein